MTQDCRVLAALINASDTRARFKQAMVHYDDDAIFPTFNTGIITLLSACHHGEKQISSENRQSAIEAEIAAEQYFCSQMISLLGRSQLPATDSIVFISTLKWQSIIDEIRRREAFSKTEQSVSNIRAWRLQYR